VRGNEAPVSLDQRAEHRLLRQRLRPRIDRRNLRLLSGLDPTRDQPPLHGAKVPGAILFDDDRKGLARRGVPCRFRVVVGLERDLAQRFTELLEILDDVASAPGSSSFRRPSGSSCLLRRPCSHDTAREDPLSTASRRVLCPSPQGEKRERALAPFRMTTARVAPVLMDTVKLITPIKHATASPGRAGEAHPGLAVAAGRVVGAY